MRKAIRKLGWIKNRTRYCQLIRHANRTKRMVYANLCLLRKENFDDVIFTDESSIQHTKNGCLRFRRENRSSFSEKVGKPKHPYKVHVWAGISKAGPTPICIFTGKLNAAGLQEIFQSTLLPFMKEKFPSGSHRFVQDNDPKHTSKHIKDFMQQNGIKHWRTPPESPDLNPIELVWGDLKRCLGEMHLKDKDDLVDGIPQYWDTLTPEKCTRFIGHIKKVMPHVINNNGAATGY